MSEPMLSIENLVTAFETDDGRVTAVDDVSISMEEGKTLGVVGESGCGKSVTALSILRLIPNPPGRILGGRIMYRGENLLAKSEEKMRGIRGKKISMIFQEPMTSLNPVFTIGDQIGETVRLHEGVSKRIARAKATEMLDLVGIPDPAERVDTYPHQLSGGMRQRVMIAMALACDPDLLIADEPTTALDVTIQAQILDLLKKLQEERGMAVMLITHDLGVVAETCSDVVVMYAGKVIERAGVAEIFETPRHPYTSGLLASIPGRHARSRRGADPGAESSRSMGRTRLPAIPGTVPSLLDLPGGCRFRTRCQEEVPECAAGEPRLSEWTRGHHVACVKGPREKAS